MQLGTLVRLPRTVKNLQRLREILGVVAKWGFGDLLARLDLESVVERGRNLLLWRRNREAAVRYTTEERIRLALEELGPTFIKLGQILATRPDLIPMSLVHELRKLQDDVPPFDGALARRQVEASLGRPVEQLFARFDEHPLAAASIAQVHRARLHGGDEVVVKVRRPHLEAIVRTDLEIMRALAALLEQNAPELEQWQPRAIVEEFQRALSREVDLTNEAFHLLRFAANFAGDPQVHVPKVYLELSREAVLVVEYIDGVKFSDLAGLDRAGIDRQRLARVGVTFCLEQVFEHGFFHADPHPGNLFALPGEVIAPIDMGMMGSLEPETVDALLELLVGLLLRDADKIVKLLFRLGLIDDRVDVPAMRHDVKELIDRYWAVPIGQIDVADLIGRLFEMLQRHHVVMPSELLLIGKALATVEGMARELDPELDPLRAIRPYILRQYLKRLSDPRWLARDVLDTGRSWLEAVRTVPADLRSITSDLRRGDLQLKTRIEGVETLVREQGRSANRSALATVVAATLLGSAWLLTSEVGPRVLGLALTSWLGVAGLLLAGGGWSLLVLGFLRSGRF
ncbi:MAG: AarF/ABC1/UbiB kinase family protein [Deltaproteobacteria bacterium]|nr:AarF/ABC1/UbiB kinase family protein [Deltaproteobacteria bacterium]